MRSHGHPLVHPWRQQCEQFIACMSQMLFHLFITIVGLIRILTFDMFSPLFWVLGRHSLLKASAVKRPIYIPFTHVDSASLKPDVHMIITVGDHTATLWQCVSDQSATCTGQSVMRPRVNLPSYVARIAV